MILQEDYILEINGEKVIGNAFAYNGCHKIYILEDKEDTKEALNLGYKIYLLEIIEDVFNNSCELRFIHNWKLTKTYIQQYEDFNFKWIKEKN